MLVLLYSFCGRSPHPIYPFSFIFSNNVGSNSKQITDNRGGGDVASRNVELEQMKEARLQKLRSEQKEKELESCTFIPVVHKTPKHSQKSVSSLRGVDKHLQRKADAEEKRAELAKPFYCTGKNYTGKPTQVQPFKFLTSTRSMSRKYLVYVGGGFYSL